VHLLDARGDHEAADLLEIATLTNQIWNSNDGESQALCWAWTWLCSIPTMRMSSIESKAR
jgi:hypothetical protein